jgi:predicted metalloprotease with PDZ domain
MLTCALGLKDILRIYVDKFLEKKAKGQKKIDEIMRKLYRLDGDDWDTLQQLHDALQPFDEVTVAL